MAIASAGATIPGAMRHLAQINGTELQHYVSAGTRGSPILLVHGFPETWWTFHKVIPLLAKSHRVFAIDLPGLGDSSHADGSYDSKTTAETLHALVTELSTSVRAHQCSGLLRRGRLPLRVHAPG